MENNKYKLLLVEDDASIRSALTTVLQTEGYQVIFAGNCALARGLFSSHRPDLVILDLGLPDADGITLLDFIRADGLTPVIVLSARSDEKDKVTALDRGANDYVTKPFSSAELSARIRTALRYHRHRADSGKLPGGRFRLRDLEIDYDARQVFVSSREIKLSQTEYNILVFLSEHSGKMMTYSSIIKGVWGYADEGSVKKLQVNMANIRRKFGVKPGEATYITNELGVGYRMNAERAEDCENAE